MLPLLDDIEARVTGALIEKERTTPEYYPLSLNALTNACNQKNNRDPIVAYDEPTVTAALDRLRAKNIAITMTGTGIRVPKFKQNLTGLLNLSPTEIPVVAVLLLRGPQTAGEVRSRTAPMHQFQNLAEVDEVIAALSGRSPDPLVVQLPRRPGQKEVRFMHLLSGPPAAGTDGDSPPVVPLDRRIEQLESEVELLKEQLNSLGADLAAFKKQFEGT